MDNYLIDNLVSPSSKYPDDGFSLISMDLSETEKDMSGKKAESSLESGKKRIKLDSIKKLNRIIARFLLKI